MAFRGKSPEVPLSLGETGALLPLGTPRTGNGEEKDSWRFVNGFEPFDDRSVVRTPL
jgi:hypothetical protein